MRKLLIVDDEDGVRSLVRMTLESDNYQILEATEGEQAIEMVKRHRPGLVLLDVMLPDTSGIEICRKLKSDPDTASTTIVMLTAKAQTADLEEAEAAGADGYFTKPFSPIALMQRVERIFGAAI
ncbi:MAG TPA: response regulator [Acidimicrobiales bacterium]|nr:response regulator [Acidimicrobiales bacterium]